MERQKYIARLTIIISLAVIAFQTGYSQTSYQEQIYHAYRRGNMTKWFEIMGKFEGSINADNQEQNLELINYFYGYAGWLVSIKNSEEAEKYIDKANLILDKILDKNPKCATALAYKGAFLAYEIGISNFKAIYLGYKSEGYINQALVIDPTNIQANIEKGNSLYYRPASFGGDKKQAIIQFKNAIKYIEQKQLAKYNWMYLNVMTMLGMAYEATDQIMNAKLCYEKIIRCEPDFMWVGEELYPDMLKRYNL